LLKKAHLRNNSLLHSNIAIKFSNLASGNDGLEIAVTNYNHLEQSICITATFIF